MHLPVLPTSPTAPPARDEVAAGTAPLGVYSGLKVLHFPQAIMDARLGVALPTLHLNVDLTNVCDHACGFCMWQVAFDLGGVHREVGLKDMIPRARIEPLIDEIVRAGVRGVEITGGGEPTVHPDFDRFATGLLDAGLRVGVITNGTFLHKHLEVLARAAFVRVSLSSLREDVHRLIRQPKTKHRVAETLAALRDLCLTPAGDAERQISVGFTIQEENYTEVYDLCSTAKALGCQNVRLTMTWVDDAATRYAAIWPQVAAQAARARADLVGDGFAIYGPEEWQSYQANDREPYDKCAYSHFVANLTADGKVWPCCIVRHQAGWAMGSIHEEGLDSILLGARRAKFVREINPSTDCPPCIWRPKNIAMRALLDGNAVPPTPDPPLPHAEFI